jgi:hypothetical protein
MFEWLKTVNGKNLRKDPSLQSNQPKDGLVNISNDISIEANLSIDLDKKEISDSTIAIIKKF